VVDGEKLSFDFVIASCFLELVCVAVLKEGVSIIFVRSNFHEMLLQGFKSFNVLFKKANDSVRRETLYNILTEFGIPKKLVRLIKMCFTETYSRVRVGKN
jgi:hypothetical protein